MHAAITHIMSFYLFRFHYYELKFIYIHFAIVLIATEPFFCAIILQHPVYVFIGGDGEPSFSSLLDPPVQLSDSVMHSS